MHAADTPTNSPRSSVRLPFEFQHGSVIVRARVNATNTEFSFKLDTGKGEIIPLEFPKDTPVVEAAIHFPNRPPVTARYEIDSGCDGALCLGHDFVEANRLDETANSAANDARQGVGGSVNTRPAQLHQFQLGKVTLDNLPANCFLEGSPVDDGL